MKQGSALIKAVLWSKSRLVLDLLVFSH